MRTAVHGETHLLAHCIFRWQEDMGGHRLYVIDPRHCLNCLVELRRVAPRASLSWLDDGGVLGAPRRIGGHCEFHSEAAPDVRSQGSPIRIYWIDALHCDACVDIAQEVFTGETGVVLVDRRPAAAGGKVAPQIRRS